MVGVFAGSTFDPKESVVFRDGSKISLPEYAGRMSIQLLKAADLNAKLRERGCANNITVQRICKAAKNEELYEFERMLDERK